MALSAALTSRNRSRNDASSASGSSSESRSRSVIQPGPMASVMSADSFGLASRTKRRGVTPLVTLVNLSGKYSLKSGSTLSRSSCECSSATPLTFAPATVAR